MGIFIHFPVLPSPKIFHQLEINQFQINWKSHGAFEYCCGQRGFLAPVVENQF